LGEVATLARFLISLLNPGLVSDQRAADGGVKAGVKKGEDKQPNYPSNLFKSSRSLRKIGSDVLGNLRVRDNFPQSPSKQKASPPVS
jgi:hypothetical protein